MVDAFVLTNWFSLAGVNRDKMTSSQWKRMHVSKQIRRVRFREALLQTKRDSKIVQRLIRS